MAAVLHFSRDRFALFVDEATFSAVQSGVASWRDYGDWRAEGFDNSLYPKGELPLKRIALTDDGHENFHIALYSYSLACKQKFLNGPPVALLIVTAHNAQKLLDGVLDGSIVPRPDQYGMHLAKPLSRYGFLDYIVHPLSVEIGMHLLSTGLTFVEQHTLRYPETIAGNPVLATNF